MFALQCAWIASAVDGMYPTCGLGVELFFLCPCCWSFPVNRKGKGVNRDHTQTQAINFKCISWYNELKQGTASYSICPGPRSDRIGQTASDCIAQMLDTSGTAGRYSDAWSTRQPYMEQSLQQSQQL